MVPTKNLPKVDMFTQRTSLHREIKSAFVLLALAFFVCPAVDSKAQTALDLPPAEVLTPKEESLLSKLESKSLLAFVVEAGPDATCVIKNKTFALKAPCLIPQGTEFKVPKANEVAFRPMPGITTIIEADTTAKLNEIGFEKKQGKIVNRRSYIYLKEGSVFSSLKKFNKQTTDYAVQTPQAVVGAKGTQFVVVYRNGKGKVGVLSGIVEVKTTNGKIVSIPQNNFLDIQGIGSSVFISPLRPPSPEEQKEMEAQYKQASDIEAVESPQTSPFFTLSEATKSIGTSSSDSAGNPASDLLGVSEIVSPVPADASGNVSSNPSNTPPAVPVSPSGS